MAELPKNIQVTLIDDVAGVVLQTFSMSATELPESFEPTEFETTLRIQEEDWIVAEATPRNRVDYSGSGKLTLRLRRKESISLDDILYSLPSICDRIPAVGSNPLKGDECILAEDDWRQFELVSLAFSEESDKQIEAVYRIHEEEGAAVGWRKIHVRSQPDPPLDAMLTRADLERAFGRPLAFRGVAYQGASSPIVGGFSFRAPDGLQCYGIEERGQLTTLAIDQDLPEHPPQHSAEALARLAKDFDLELIRWCRCARASWSLPLFREMLLGSNR